MENAWLARVKKSIGMREKLIALFIVIKVFPLILLALIAWDKSVNLSEVSNKALQETQELTLEGTQTALTDLARQNIEHLTTNTALQVADFLYSRDSDIMGASYLVPNTSTYSAFLKGQTARTIVQGEWIMDQSDTSNTALWKSTEVKPEREIRTSSNSENSLAFNYRPADSLKYETVPLFREITFVDLNGQEQVKVTHSSFMDKELKDVSKKENTFIKAENYFASLSTLKQGEIYVSDVIGAYVPSKIIGIYNKFNADRVGIEYEPEKAAFAGKENPVGKHFEGIVRWATPVYQNGKKIGYVTLALNYDIILKLVASLTPDKKRYTELSDAYEGNYTFIWDYKGRNIAHPRHHSIAGYDPNTGDPSVPWLEQSIYDRWIESGKSYVDFIVDEPTFIEQSTKKKPAQALTKEGLAGLDCRYLNNAPQCTGWFDLAGDGGSGSLIILWSGLTKLSTAAAIPYYTGQYADSNIGFGFVAISAGLDDFLRSATETGIAVEAIIENSNKEMEKTLLETAYSLSLSTILMTLAVIFIAIWLASSLIKHITFINNGILRFRNGERQFRFNQAAHDEMGVIYESFNIMAASIDNNINDIFIITDTESNIIYANDIALDALGLSLDMTIGKNYEEISFFGSENPLTRYHHNLPQEIQQHPVTNLYYKDNVEKFYNDKQIHTGYIITLQDITSIVLQQQEIDLQRRLLLTMFASSPDLIWFKNAENRYLAVNPRFCAIINKNAEDIVDQDASDILPQNLLNADASNDEKAKNTGTAIYSEEEYTFGDGHQEILEIIRTPVYNERDEYDGVIGMARDMSVRINIENHLRETQSNLENAIFRAHKANVAKSAFLTRMSHEIRTPMNAIIGMSTIAKAQLELPKATTSDVYSHISQIEISAKHLLSLVNEILETSKIDTKKITLQNEAFEMSMLIEDVNNILNKYCLEAQVKLNIDMLSLDKQNVLSDPMRIRQVFITLLSNAITHTNAHGIVNFTATQEQVSGQETRFTFTIKNHGIAMNSEKINAIENPLEIDVALLNSEMINEDFSLSLCQHIVQHLGGKIKIGTSENGNTIAFTFCLEQVGKEAITPIDLDILAGKRILLVDDVEINRMILRSLLATVKIQTEEASDGIAAVDMFTAAPIGYYDIILMDIQMPKMNGFEATEAIRNIDRPDALTIPILAVTANTFKEDIQKSLDSGMNAHFSKPVDKDNLFTAISNLLTQKLK